MAEYKAVEDGWYDQAQPCYLAVTTDHFDADTLVVEISFDMGENCERPKAVIPLLYSRTKMVPEFKDGKKVGEHAATQEDQRNAFAFLGRLFPEWTEFCKEDHTTDEKLYWFNDHYVDVVATHKFDIKVSHSSGGFAKCIIKDPANAKPKRERVTKGEAITRAEAAFESLFGTAKKEDTPADADGIPF